ncbi:MAG TPA: glycerol kinase GlpK [Kofleriaceae bacterium]|nr:glycerol kinase GlpK [Kofleriaceae bacterium]
MKHVVAIDQGTTGTTVLVLDEELRIVGRDTREFRQIYPQPGWVEHDPDDIWRSVEEALSGALGQAGIDAATVAAVGITNQRETAVVWERRSLRPARTAIVWQDRRTADRCAALKQAGHEQRVRRVTGLVIDPYFSATKFAWMLENDADLRRRATSGEVAFGTVDSYLVARLTGGAVHVTDATNASRTLLCGLESLDWDVGMLQLFGVPREALPEVRPSAAVLGETRGVAGLRDGVPIAGMAGDQQAALFGQACFTPGDAKCTYGTGAFILMNTGDRPVPSKSGLLTTVGWQLGAGAESGEVTYALEGSAFIAGAAVQWLRDGLGLIAKASDIEALAQQVPDSGGVTLVPAFAGLGAPHWRPEARGLLTGLTRGTTAAHIARACLEGIALQNVDLIRAMESDSGAHLRVLKVDGGASADDLLMQMQADMLGVSISRPEFVETTAQGAAFLAGIGAGLWKGKSEITRVWREQRRFEPAGDRSRVDEALARWRDAVARA